MEHEQIFPRAGWVEHNGIEIWNNTREVIGGALARPTSDADNIEAVGITNQRETAMVWDKNTGQPVYNAIVWQDTRTQKICDDLAALGGGADRYKSKVGSAAGDVLLRSEGPLDPRQRRRSPREGRSR